MFYLPFPLQQCRNGTLLSSRTRICTGHISRSPTEVIFQGEFGDRDVRLENGTVVTRTDVIYEVVQYINGIQRPPVVARNEAGRYLPLQS